MGTVQSSNGMGEKDGDILYPHFEIIYGDGTMRIEGETQHIGGFQFEYLDGANGRTRFSWNFGEKRDTEIFVHEAKHRNMVIIYNMNQKSHLPSELCNYTGQLAIKQSTFLASSYGVGSVKPTLLEFAFTEKSDEFQKATTGNLNESTKPLNSLSNKIRNM